jgi:hypothetical protein
VTPANQAEPNLADVAAAFPRWHCRRGTSGLYYARLRDSSPPVIVQGEDALDLRDMIIRAESQLAGEEAAPGPGDSTAGPYQ